jgi:hypothetical protein
MPNVPCKQCTTGAAMPRPPPTLSWTERISEQSAIADFLLDFLNPACRSISVGGSRLSFTATCYVRHPICLDNVNPTALSN